MDETNKGCLQQSINQGKIPQMSMMMQMIMMMNDFEFFGHTDFGKQCRLRYTIRLLLEEQSDQGLQCLLFHLHHLYFYSYNTMIEPLSLNVRVLVGVQKFSIFTV